MTALGYPAYVVTLLGVWKVLGAVALTVPGFPRLKEWAYAGVAFDLSGATVSHLVSGSPAFHAVVPVVLLAVAALSWATRPASRRLAAPAGAAGRARPRDGLSQSPCTARSTAAAAPSRAIALWLPSARSLSWTLPGLQVALAEHEGEAGTGAVGGLHRALEAAAAVGEVGADARAAQSTDDPDEPVPGRLPQRHAEHLDPRGRVEPASSARQASSVRSTPMPNPTPESAWPPTLGHEAVVAPAAADARLRAQAVVDELERGLGVVVEPAHHPRVLDVGHAEGVEVALDRRVVRGRLVGEVVDHQRGVGELLADLGALVVEHPQRVDPRALAGGLVEVELLEEPRAARRGTAGACSRRPGS